MKKLLLLPASILLLQGCGDETGFSYPDLTPNDLSYIYPAKNQQQVPPRAPVVVRFSNPVKAFDSSDMTQPEVDQVLADLRAAISAEVVWQRDSDSAAVSYSVDLVDSDDSDEGYAIYGFSLVPQAPLQTGKSYTVDLSALQTDKGTANINGGPIGYQIRGDKSGPRAGAITQEPFIVERLIPDDGELPVVDFTTMRVQFSHPLDLTTVKYGDTVSLKDDEGNVVPANVFANGAKLTVDPIEDLAAGVSYTLALTSGLQDLYGEAIADVEWSATPKSTHPRSALAQRADTSSDDALTQCDKTADGVLLSGLTGDAINCVPVRAVLLGNDTAAQTSGNLFAELAYIPRFEDATPLRIEKGTLLNGASIEVLVAGEVPLTIDTNSDGIPDTALETGNISVAFIADASGYLIKNPFTNKPDQPRHVRLWLDLAMNAEVSPANGAFSQDLLHVEVVGTAIVNNGKMVIDAIGVVEPRVLGLEDSYGVLSFHMESYEDPNDAPAPVVDAELPFVQSWMPNDNAAMQRPGDPIIINFNEPMDVSSLEQSGALALTRNGSAEPFDWSFDGSTLVIRPQGGLDFSAGGADVTYAVALTSMLRDLSGNQLDQDYDLSFVMPTYFGSGNRAAIATSTYPGYPCAIESGTMNLAANSHGRCRGGDVSGVSQDDVLPVTTLPENRAIHVQFSQAMDPASFVVGENCGEGTFRVEQVDNSGNCVSVVPGELDLNARTLRFMPHEPWQQGQLYHYVMASVGNSFTSASCGVGAVCTTYQYPLQTVVLEGRAANVGGPDMNIYFRGAAPVTNVFQTLQNLPTLDTNANYALEAGEGSPQPDPDNAGQFLTPLNSTKLEVRGRGGLLQSINLGCHPDDAPCDDKKYIYLTGALTADVVGYDSVAGGIQVLIYPTVLVTTSLNTFADILIAGESEIPTGPQVMRIRYAGSGASAQPVNGYIRTNAEGVTVLDITLDVYLDAPELEPHALGLTMSHDLHSYPLSLQLSGPVTLLEDGRMIIEQANVVASTDIDVSIGLELFGALIGAANMQLGIPEGGIALRYLGAPMR
ncbi:MAG: Ig-like domain-containing protein [Gammaproteobacteria bacterium]|nr:Ig-like domain-containing protein [Gammaproteobacteria bacterium]MBQ0774841.1 Ig-like domain-containing protein [Gammaproteobacteria bacterium]